MRIRSWIVFNSVENLLLYYRIKSGIPVPRLPETFPIFVMLLNLLQTRLYMEDVKRIPYGVSNFVDVIEQNQYYVDKTMYLPLLEDQPSYLFLIRPRRFGKSIFLSMMSAYYDIARKDEFERLFGNLWIGSHPTRLRGTFQIMSFDFSRVGGSREQLEENFQIYCTGELNIFMNKYYNFYSDHIRTQFEAAPTFEAKLQVILGEAGLRSYSLYLIVDEYDNFTNVVLNEHGENIYHNLTHADGFYRNAFKKFKGTFDRILMMGVSPVTLDDLTSGFNIGWNISTLQQFNTMLGFSETDVRQMFQYYKDCERLKGDIDEMIAEIKPWYDNYCFSEESLNRDPKMFNCDMVLYYLRQKIDLGYSPKQMIDPNTRTDYSKMKKLLNLDHLDGDRKGVIRRIAEDGQIVADLVLSFPAKDLVNPALFPSLLFYYGMLTIIGTRGVQLILGIPNNNVRKQYYDYMLEQYQGKERIDLTDLIGSFYNMAFDGDWRPALEKMAHDYKENSSVRSLIEGERNIQGFFQAYLSINAYYLTAPEVELNHGFCDMFLMPDLQRYPEVKHSYILELKYLSAKDYDVKGEAQWEDAITQIHRYAQGAKVQLMCQGTTLHCIVMQFSGWELVRMEEV